MKKELTFEGVTVVFDNDKHNIDTKREYLLYSILGYAILSNREVKIVFFNGQDDENGVTFFFKRLNNELDKPHL